MWVAWGVGRVPVGFAPGDADFGVIEATGGSKAVTLSIAEMPSHTHSYNSYRNRSGTSWYAPVGGSVYLHDNTWASGSAGGSQPHNNRQPDQVCYIWKRSV